MESTLGSGSSCLSGKGHGFFCPMQDTSGRNSTFCHWGILFFFFLIELSVLFAVIMSAVCLYCVRCAGLFSLLKTWMASQCVKFHTASKLLECETYRGQASSATQMELVYFGFAFCIPERISYSWGWPCRLLACGSISLNCCFSSWDFLSVSELGT